MNFERGDFLLHIPIPKDFFNDIEPKVMFGLTKRQLICFTLGGIVGLPVFFLLQKINPTLATLGTVLSATPFFFAGLFKKNQQTLEVLIKNIYLVKFGGKPKIRLYKNENFFEQLERQYNLDSEIMRVITSRKVRKIKVKADNSKGKQVKKIKKKKVVRKPKNAVKTKKIKKIKKVKQVENVKKKI